MNPKKILLLGAGHSRDKMLIHDELTPESTFEGVDLVIHDIDPDVADATLRFDLETLPYPLGENEYEEIHAYEVLEHCGTQGDARFFFGQFKELWRALKHGGLLALSVPVWNSEAALGVPDHKRVLTPGIFGFLSAQYERRLEGVPGVGDYRRYRGPMDFRMCAMDVHAPSQRFFCLLQALKTVGSESIQFDKAWRK